jgi:type II secretory pathway component PulF
MSAFLKMHPLGIAILAIVALLFIGVIGTSSNSEEAAQSVVWFCIFLYLVLVFNIVGRVHALPLRRQENALLFLDVLALGLKKGRSPEETFLSLSKTDDPSLDIFCKPKSPMSIGIIYLFIGCCLAMVGFAFVYELMHESELAYAIMSVPLVFLSAMYFWSGWQLINYRYWGRQLAIYLAWFNIGIAVIGLMCTGALGGAEATVGWFLFMVMPVMILFPFVLVELTHPQVVAMCGREGLQPPPLLAHLRSGLDLVDALKKSPWQIEERLVSLLEVGRELGDMKKILPAARAMFATATGHVRKAQMYTYPYIFFVSGVGIIIPWIIMVFVVPKFESIFRDMLGKGERLPDFTLLVLNISNISWLFAGLASLVTLGFLLGAVLYVGGPRVRYRLSRVAPGFCARLALALPWWRKKLQCDFSGRLSIMLDAGVSESRAVTLAAEGTGNLVLQQRALRACADLKNGKSLPEAIQHLDSSEELRWRLETVARSGKGFLPALRAWHETLSAQASQQEQAVAQVVVTGMILSIGVMVGSLVIGMFLPLVVMLDKLASY